MENVQGYTKLIVWQKSMVLIQNVYEFIKVFPTFERYGLCDQIRRSAVSVAVNIAEGHGREGSKSFAYFLGVSRGSLAELHTLIMIAQRVGYDKSSQSENLIQGIFEIRRLLHGLLRSLQ